MSRSLVAATVLFAITAGAVNAADTTVPFTATLTGTCVLNVATPGTLAPNADYTVLSSEEAGGIAGQFTALTTNAGYQLSTQAPTAFIQTPTGFSDTVTFESKYSASGVTSVTDALSTTTTPLGLGLTNVAVNLKATNQTGTYPAGAYRAEVTVTCE